MDYYFEAVNNIPAARYSHIEGNRTSLPKVNSFSSGFNDSQLTYHSDLIKFCDPELYDIPLDL